LRKKIEEGGYAVQIEMDGGVGESNIGEVVAAGVDMCVAGSAIFGTEDPIATMARLRALAGGEA
jgi:ribulose-phosphate 3-epimerase